MINNKRTCGSCTHKGICKLETNFKQLIAKIEGVKETQSYEEFSVDLECKHYKFNVTERKLENANYF